ncbi:hypothetical protein EDB84DRAFT_1635572 [Lactarius hengduanensis]|nr:hypothetical protein EDB84DRAFT_1635572 [Lactarius hengduanensis]
MCPYPFPTRVLGAASPQDSLRVSPDRVATVMRKVMRLEDETLLGRPRFGVSALQTDVQRDEGCELCCNAVPDAVPTVGDWKSKKGGSVGAGSLHSKTPSCARVAACGRTKSSAPTDGWKMSPRRESAQRCFAVQGELHEGVLLRGKDHARAEGTPEVAPAGVKRPSVVGSESTDSRRRRRVVKTVWNEGDWSEERSQTRGLSREPVREWRQFCLAKVAERKGGVAATKKVRQAVRTWHQSRASSTSSKIAVRISRGSEWRFGNSHDQHICGRDLPDKKQDQTKPAAHHGTRPTLSRSAIVGPPTDQRPVPTESSHWWWQLGIRSGPEAVPEENVE